MTWQQRKGTKYEISKEGQVRNMQTGRILKPCISNKGYLMVNLSEHLKTVHKLVWEAFKGVVPPGRLIDHIDRDKTNNKLSNLRLVTVSQNAVNRKKRFGRSKFRGVSFDKFTGRWKAVITKDYKRITIGRFDSEEDAAQAYNERAVLLHDGYATLNEFI